MRSGQQWVVPLTAVVCLWAATMVSGAWAQQALATPVPVTAERLQAPDKLVQQYEQGRVLSFDMQVDEHSEEKRALMSEISGMVIGENKQVYLKKGPQGTRFLVLEKNIAPEKQAQAVNKFVQAGEHPAAAR